MNEQLYPEPPPGPCICDQVNEVELIVPRIDGSVVADCPMHADEYCVDDPKTLLGAFLKEQGGGMVRDEARPSGYRYVDSEVHGVGRTYTGTSAEFHAGGTVRAAPIVVGPEVYDKLVKHYEDKDLSRRGPVVLPSDPGPGIESIEGVKVEIDWDCDDPRKGEELIERFIGVDPATPEGGHALTGTVEGGFVRFKNTWGAGWGRD